MTRSNTHQLFVFAIEMLVKSVYAYAAEIHKRRPSSDHARFTLFLELRDNSR
jgi:hypothetical protein